jgi:cytosine/adenosine deaminase-related metal-dependent hydrolase
VLAHGRLDYFLCELNQGSLRSLIIHLSEGAPTDSSAHREFTMLDKAGLLKPGMVVVRGTALRDADFVTMQKAGLGLVWSPRRELRIARSRCRAMAAST